MNEPPDHPWLDEEEPTAITECLNCGRIDWDMTGVPMRCPECGHLENEIEFFRDASCAECGYSGELSRFEHAEDQALCPYCRVRGPQETLGWHVTTSLFSHGWRDDPPSSLAAVQAELDAMQAAMAQFAADGWVLSSAQNRYGDVTLVWPVDDEGREKLVSMSGQQESEA